MLAICLSFFGYGDKARRFLSIEKRWYFLSKRAFDFISDVLILKLKMKPLVSPS